MYTGPGETPVLITRHTKYSTLMTSSQRKAEAVKRKLDKELVASSLDTSEEENGRQEEKKRKIDHEKKHNLLIKRCVRKPGTP